MNLGSKIEIKVETFLIFVLGLLQAQKPIPYQLLNILEHSGILLIVQWKGDPKFMTVLSKKILDDIAFRVVNEGGGYFS